MLLRQKWREEQQEGVRRHQTKIYIMVVQDVDTDVNGHKDQADMLTTPRQTRFSPFTRNW